MLDLKGPLTQLWRALYQGERPMNRIALGTVVFLALAAPAQAQTMTCEMLRYYASIYPRSVLEHYAKLYHVTAAQRRAAYACLRGKSVDS